MPLLIVRNDITKMKVDAIVNAANSSLLGGGGVDGAIHRAAGPKLLEECKKLGGCETGSAKITNAYNLMTKYVIHTVGPVWKNGNYGEEALLRSCYRNSMKLAKEYECDSIALPLISSGAYGYPKAQALRIAIEEMNQFLLENEMRIYLVIFDKATVTISEKLFADIKQYIDDHYVDLHVNRYTERIRQMEGSVLLENETICYECMPLPTVTANYSSVPKPEVSLETLLEQIDESFSEMLLRKIDEKGMTDVQCYKKANIDRKLFSKIRTDKNYKPKKTTAIAFAIALELSLEETKDMLMKAGYALSRSNKFDIIIEYFIVNGKYNIANINTVLFEFDQVLLGS